MAVRNFWLEANIDGRKTELSGGPQSKDGGFSLRVYVRDRGSIARAVDVVGYARSDGTLVVSVAVHKEGEFAAVEVAELVRER